MTIIDYFLITSAPIIVIGFLLSTAFTVCFALTKLDVVLDSMCLASNNYRRSVPFYGFKGKMLMVAHLSGLVTFQKVFVKAGTITIDEINTIPTDLQRYLKILFWADTVMFSTLLVGAISIKLCSH